MAAALWPERASLHSARSENRLQRFQMLTTGLEGLQEDPRDRGLPFGRMTYNRTGKEEFEFKRWSVLRRSGCETEREVDAKELFKDERSGGYLGNDVACMRDDAGRKMEPVVAETPD